MERSMVRTIGVCAAKLAEHEEAGARFRAEAWRPVRDERLADSVDEIRGFVERTVIGGSMHLGLPTAVPKNRRGPWWSRHGVKCVTVPGETMLALECLGQAVRDTAAFEVRLVRALFAGAKTIVVLRNAENDRWSVLHGARDC